MKVQCLFDYLENEYGPWVKQNRKTGKSTISRIKSSFPDLLSKQMDQITPWLVEKWRASRLKDGKKPSTINRDIVALKAALSKAVDWRFLDEHPILKIKPLRVDDSPNIRFLSAEEEKRLRTAIDKREDKIRRERESGNKWRKVRSYELYPVLNSTSFADYVKPMFILAINTGIRRGELFTLIWKNIDLKNNILTVVGDDAKSNRTRHIPLNNEASEALEKWKNINNEESGLVFPSKEGKPITSLKKVWDGLRKTAQLEGFRWHDLRHTFASKLVMAGVDLNTVRELLGHSDIKMTLRYAHLAHEHKAKAVTLICK